MDVSGRLGVHLQLSGHTHGGQFFPFNLLIRFFQPIVSGGPPSRLGVGGGITLLELRRAW